MDIGLHQPQEMNDSRDGGQVDRAMQHRPTLPAQPADPSRRGGEGQRDHQDEARESYGDVAPLQYVRPNAVKIEDLVKRQINTEMAASVKKREQPQHASETDQLRLAKDF